MEDIKIPSDLQKCVDFHGHLCPGLIYGYIVSKEAKKLLELGRSSDEEIVAICENDSCAIDAIQVMLGTSAGKGNLILHDYGKNAYTIISRSSNKAFRFSRLSSYSYTGKNKEEFEKLDEAFASGKITPTERIRHKMLKSMDLLEKPFNEVFSIKEADIPMPSYASIAPSEACAICKEMTMATKLIKIDIGHVCIPCSKQKPL
ncbi:MAG: formylmethanofuran dehydrogenase [Desulfobacterales bacterium]|nr:formylmethanofuran dehydrogenase [Desulfobacterales bacterium]